MTGSVDEGRTGRLTAVLQRRLRRDLPQFADAPLAPLQDTGLAHDHIAIVGTGLLARIPKQSQMRLSARDNLAYQSACFARAAVSGHTPSLVHVLAPDDDLPRGALIVTHVDGRLARLPRDLTAIAEALAAIHTLPLPPTGERPPLLSPRDPLADLADEISRQATESDEAALQPHVRHVIREELHSFRRLVAEQERPPACLISFDAHPGNFLVTPAGRAVLVDLEKARYAYAPLDLAHATLYTSTTWDVRSRAVLTAKETGDFHRTWLASAPQDLADGSRRWLGPLRRAMWLWSLTWCAKWRALSPRVSVATGDGEDWSKDNSEHALVAHVRDRVDCYLSANVVDMVREDIAALDRAMSE